MTQCVLLNADFSFLNMVHWKRAFCLMAKGKVEVVRDSQKTIRNSSGRVFKVPAVMRLIQDTMRGMYYVIEAAVTLGGLW